MLHKDNIQVLQGTSVLQVGLWGNHCCSCDSTLIHVGSPRDVFMHVWGSIGYLGVKGQKKKKISSVLHMIFLVADDKTGMLSSGVGAFWMMDLYFSAEPPW